MDNHTVNLPGSFELIYDFDHPRTLWFVYHLALRIWANPTQYLHIGETILILPSIEFNHLA